MAPLEVRRKLFLAVYPAQTTSRINSEGLYRSEFRLYFDLEPRAGQALHPKPHALQTQVPGRVQATVVLPPLLVLLLPLHPETANNLKLKLQAWNLNLRFLADF